MAHKDDCPDQAITNKYILRWSENDDIRPKIREDERDAYFANTVFWENVPLQILSLKEL